MFLAENTNLDTIRWMLHQLEAVELEVTVSFCIEARPIYHC